MDARNGNIGKRKYKSMQMERITTTLEPGVKELLDVVASNRGISRSEAVAEAIRDYVARAQDDSLDATFGLMAELRRIESKIEGVRGRAVAAETAANVAYVALHESSAEVRQLPYEEARRRAQALRQKGSTDE